MAPSLRGDVWHVIGFTVFGLTLSVLYTTIAYLFVGWLIVVALKPILNHVPYGGLWLLRAGGLCDTVGVVFISGTGCATITPSGTPSCSPCCCSCSRRHRK